MGEKKNSIINNPVLVIEAFRNDLNQVIGNAVMAGIPAYQVEGVLDGALADIRKQRCIEVSKAYAQLIVQMQDEKKDIGHDDE